jgi:hypothetical protein
MAGVPSAVSGQQNSELSSHLLKCFRNVIITSQKGLTKNFANYVPETSKKDILDVVPDVTRLLQTGHLGNKMFDSV